MSSLYEKKIKLKKFIWENDWNGRQPRDHYDHTRGHVKSMQVPCMSSIMSFLFLTKNDNSIRTFLLSFF